jgi:hypothetical protein
MRDLPAATKISDRERRISIGIIVILEGGMGLTGGRSDFAEVALIVARLEHR